MNKTDINIQKTAIKAETYLAYEIEFYEKFNEGNDTVELMRQNSSLTEDIINIVINKLTSKGEITYVKSTKSYKYSKKIDESKRIILDGNILLPVTVIKRDGKTYVVRGNWYVFDGDFDIRNIIWNVELPDKNNKTTELYQLVQNQLMTHKRANVKQVEKYNNLRNIIVPYNDNLVLKLITIGEVLTDTELIFNFIIKDVSGMAVTSRKLRLKTTISTTELINELSKPADVKRNYDNIKINKMYNLSDFIIKGNALPISVSENQITYLEINRTAHNISLIEYIHTFNGEKQTGEVYEFSLGDGFNFIRELFDEKVSDIISNSGIFIDV